MAKTLGERMNEEAYQASSWEETCKRICEPDDRTLAALFGEIREGNIDFVSISILVS